MVCISGNLTRDPEMRMTQGGQAIMGLGVAVNDRRRNPQTEQWEDYTNFVDVTVFGRRAESLQPILVKGMQVTVSGRLHWSQWEKDGQKRSKLEVYADELQLPPNNRGGQQAPVSYDTPEAVQQAFQSYAPQPQQAYVPQPQAGYAPQQWRGSESYYSDEQIPF